MLGTAALTVDWVDCALPGRCDTAIAQLEFEVLVRKGTPPKPGKGRGVEAMGHALLPLDEPGCYVVAFYGNVQRITENTGTIGAGELLGCVIAHEIGHLLLGPQHVQGTIMKGQWNESDLKLMTGRIALQQFAGSL